jgi:hypothetical protein
MPAGPPAIILHYIWSMGLKGFDRGDRRKNKDARDGEGTLNVPKKPTDNFVGSFAQAA